MLLLTSGSGGSFRVTATVTGRVTRGVPAPAVRPAPGSRRGSWAWPAGQEWRYMSGGRDGKVTEYAIASLGSGQCLVPSGPAVSQGSCAGAARGWEFRITDGAYDFNPYNKATGRCPAVDGNSQFAGARLRLVACDTAPGAIWHSSFAD